MRKIDVNPRHSSLPAVIIAGFIVLYSSPNRESHSQKVTGINIESSNMIGSAEMEFISRKW